MRTGGLRIGETYSLELKGGGRVEGTLRVDRDGTLIVERATYWGPGESDGLGSESIHVDADAVTVAIRVSARA